MISKLPAEIQSAFRTGITITSLSQCVIELNYGSNSNKDRIEKNYVWAELYEKFHPLFNEKTFIKRIPMVLNSLDAKSTRIGVRVDLNKYQLQVVDNGCGIDREQLQLVGERYMTSKCSSLADLEGRAQYYGFRGEALASIKDACEALVVISKPEGHSTTYSKVMKGDENVNNRISKAMLNRPGSGTTVAVTNLFHNLPVRRRRMNNVIELEQLRHQIQAIALIHPKISFTLRDDVTKSVVFNTKKCSNIIENFNQINKLVDMPMTQLLMSDLTDAAHLEKLDLIQLPFQIASNLNLNCVFSKHHLENAEVIGLLDNRFIVTVIDVSSSGNRNTVITLFDQHAVDERIRFEKLLEEYRNEDGSFCSAALAPPSTMIIDANHMKIIKEFISKFEFLGLKLKVLDDTLTVHSVPKCLLTRAEKESASQCKELLEQGIKNLLHEQIQTFLNTGGTVLTSPETLTSIIAYEACRGAIKFGDVISLPAASSLLKKLSKCKTPYQCAHGRPVLAPIIELPPSE